MTLSVYKLEDVLIVTRQSCVMAGCNRKTGIGARMSHPYIDGGEK